MNKRGPLAIHLSSKESVGCRLKHKAEHSTPGYSTTIAYVVVVRRAIIFTSRFHILINSFSHIIILLALHIDRVAIMTGVTYELESQISNER